MYSRSILQSTSILSTLILNHYALTSAWPLQARQSASCTDPNAAFDDSCWANLNLGDFLTNPKTGWNATLGQPCMSGDNAAYCCRSTETSWSTCFIRQAINLAEKTFSCGSLNSSNCPTSSLTIVPEVAPTSQPKVRYVLQNIYTLYNLFNTWQRALPLAITDAKDNIRYLTTEVDPQGTTNLLAPDVIEAFLLGLPFLGTPNATTLIFPPISAATNATAQALLSGFQHAPAVAKKIFVNESATIYPVQSIGAADFLATNYSMGQINMRLNAGLNLIMSDLNAFVNFTSSGVFSGVGNYSIDGEHGMDVVLKSLIKSTVRKDHVYVNEKTGWVLDCDCDCGFGVLGTYGWELELYEGA